MASIGSSTSPVYECDPRARLARLSPQQVQSHQKNDRNAHQPGQDLREALRLEDIVKLKDIDDDEGHDDDGRYDSSHQTQC